MDINRLKKLWNNEGFISFPTIQMDFVEKWELREAVWLSPFQMKRLPKPVQIKPRKPFRKASYPFFIYRRVTTPSGFFVDRMEPQVLFDVCHGEQTKETFDTLKEARQEIQGLSSCWKGRVKRVYPTFFRRILLLIFGTNL